MIGGQSTQTRSHIANYFFVSIILGRFLIVDIGYAKTVLLQQVVRMFIDINLSNFDLG